MVARRLFWVVAVVVLSFQLCAGIELTGNGNVEIVVGEKPSYVAQFAAKELSTMLGRAVGAEIPVKAASDAKARLHVGVGPDGRPMAEEGDSRIVVRNDSIYIYGHDDPDGAKKGLVAMNLDVSPRGTLEAVYTFLEDYVGVRWLEPGPEGEYIPKVERLSIPEMERTLSPTFKERRTYYQRMLGLVWYFGRSKDAPEYGTTDDFMLWCLRLRLTPFKARVMGCHTPAYLYLEEKLYPKHPEMFALQADGSRNPKDMCWTCQETKEFWWNIVDAYFRGDKNPRAAGLDLDGWNQNLFILKDEFMIDPHDYGKEFFCHCPNCTAIIKKYGEETGHGEVVFQTIAEVARKVEKKYPGKYITTLVYPPKKMYPESVELPKNLRVRMTVDSLAISDDDSVLDKELALMRRWYTEQDCKIGLWLYLISNHGEKLRGVPEFASGNFIKLLRRVSPYADSIFYEHQEPNHTLRNLDMYLIAHALWNLDMDLDAAKAEFFRLAYGPAADDMRSFCDRLERNWGRTMQCEIDHPDERPIPVAHKLKKRIFNNIYTFDELDSLQKIIDSAKAKVPKDSLAAKRIVRYENYVLEPTKKEFSVYTDDKAHSFYQRDMLCCLNVKGEPTEDDWASVPKLEMGPAESNKSVSAKSFISVVSSPNAFHVRADFEEPLLSQSRTTAEGNKLNTIWSDNMTELFFASQKTGNVVHIGINDKGQAVLHLPDGNKFSFPGDAVKTSVKQYDKGWQLTVSIDNSLTGFSPSADNDCFNIVRSRNVAKLRTEYSTYNRDCIVGRWTSPMYYSIVKRVPMRAPEKEYEGAALPVSEGAATVLDEDAVAAGVGWIKWSPTASRASFSRDAAVKHGKGASYCIDNTKDDYSVKDKSCSWRISRDIPPAGTRIRATAWVMVQSTVPDAAIRLNLNWLDSSRRWYTKQELGGARTVPAKNGEWQKIDMEIAVPNVDAIKYFSPSIGGVHTYPGKLWIGELKLETIPAQ